MVKINAYILAADPAWIEASVLSYYDLVDRIVVSYDENDKGWTGAPIAAGESIERLRAIDRDGKLIYSPGSFARLEHRPMENETFQRQLALDQAGQGADWVLQLDTDEVLADAEAFGACLKDANDKGVAAMEYPARWLYRQLGNDRYLEGCRRGGGIMAGYPGPVAVRSGTRLRHARQCEGTLFRIDFRSRNTDPWHPRNAPVHRVVKPDQAIYHFSMVRSEGSLRRKTQSFGHALDANWSEELLHWLWCGEHPYRAVVKGMLQGRRNRQHYRRPLRIARLRLPEPLAVLHDEDGGLRQSPHACVAAGVQ